MALGILASTFYQPPCQGDTLARRLPVWQKFVVAVVVLCLATLLAIGGVHGIAKVLELDSLTLFWRV